MTRGPEEKSKGRLYLVVSAGFIGPKSATHSSTLTTLSVISMLIILNYLVVMVKLTITDKLAIILILHVP